MFSYPFQYDSSVATSETAQALKPFHEFPQPFCDTDRDRCFQNVPFCLAVYLNSEQDQGRTQNQDNWLWESGKTPSCGLALNIFFLWILMFTQDWGVSFIMKLKHYALWNVGNFSPTKGRFLIVS